MGDPITVWIDGRYGNEELADEPDLSFRRLSADELDALEPADLHGVDALIAYQPDLPASAFDKVGPDLAFVMRPGAGYDDLDLTAATERGIVVAHAPQGPRNAVVEGTIGLLISCARSLHVHNARIRDRGFEGRGDYPAFELRGSTVGILGLGHVGTGLAERLHAFDADVLAHDPYVDETTAAAAGVDLVSLDELLTSSDFVSLHVPLTAETRHMLGEAHFRSMKDSAFLVNAARGGIYPDEVLATAIREGWIAGAAIDVYEDEPDVEDNPLLHLDQTDALLTPHILGNASADARARVRDIVVDAARSLARGECPPNVLNPEAIDGEVPDGRRSPAH